MAESLVQDESIEASEKKSVKIIIESIENIVSSFHKNYFIIIKSSYFFTKQTDYERRNWRMVCRDAQRRSVGRKYPPFYRSGFQGTAASLRCQFRR